MRLLPIQPHNNPVFSSKWAVQSSRMGWLLIAVLGLRRVGPSKKAWEEVRLWGKEVALPRGAVGEGVKRPTRL